MGGDNIKSPEETMIEMKSNKRGSLLIVEDGIEIGRCVFRKSYNGGDGFNCHLRMYKKGESKIVFIPVCSKNSFISKCANEMKKFFGDVPINSNEMIEGRYEYFRRSFSKAELERVQRDEEYADALSKMQ